MRLKSGKELPQFNLIKRLNLMGVNYNKNILGKNYYADLYDKEIQSTENQFKIKNELEKDLAYQNYFNQKLKSQKMTTLEFQPNNSSIKNNSDKIFLCDFQKKIIKELIWATTFYSFNYEKMLKKGSSFLEFAKNKANLYFNEVNIIYKEKILPYIKEVMKIIYDFIDKYQLMDYYEYLLYFVFVLVVMMTFYLLKKIFKKKTK